MPSPNYSNPMCPCCHLPTSADGKQQSGADRYRCRRGCKNERGKTVTITLSDRPAYRLKEKLATAKTQKQLNQEWKERNPIDYEESQKHRNAKRQAKLKAIKTQS